MCPHQPPTQFLELDTLLHKLPGPLVTSRIGSRAAYEPAPTDLNYLQQHEAVAQLQFKFCCSAELPAAVWAPVCCISSHCRQ